MYPSLQGFVNNVIKSLISSCTHVEVQIVPVVGFKLLHVKLYPGRLAEQNGNEDLNLTFLKPVKN